MIKQRFLPTVCPAIAGLCCLLAGCISGDSQRPETPEVALGANPVEIPPPSPVVNPPVDNVVSVVAAERNRRTLDAEKAIKGFMDAAERANGEILKIGTVVDGAAKRADSLLGQAAMSLERMKVACASAETAADKIKQPMAASPFAAIFDGIFLDVKAACDEQIKVDEACVAVERLIAELPARVAEARKQRDYAEGAAANVLEISNEYASFLADSNRLLELRKSRPDAYVYLGQLDKEVQAIASQAELFKRQAEAIKKQADLAVAECAKAEAVDWAAMLKRSKECHRTAAICLGDSMQPIEIGMVAVGKACSKAGDQVRAGTKAMAEQFAEANAAINKSQILAVKIEEIGREALSADAEIQKQTTYRGIADVLMAARKAAETATGFLPQSKAFDQSVQKQVQLASQALEKAVGSKDDSAILAEASRRANDVMRQILASADSAIQRLRQAKLSDEGVAEKVKELERLQSLADAVRKNSVDIASARAKAEDSCRPYSPAAIDKLREASARNLADATAKMSAAINAVGSCLDQAVRAVEPAGKKLSEIVSQCKAMRTESASMLNRATQAAKQARDAADSSRVRAAEISNGEWLHYMMADFHDARSSAGTASNSVVAAAALRAGFEKGAAQAAVLSSLAVDVRNFAEALAKASETVASWHATIPSSSGGAGDLRAASKAAAEKMRSDSRNADDVAREVDFSFCAEDFRKFGEVLGAAKKSAEDAKSAVAQCKKAIVGKPADPTLYESVRVADLAAWFSDAESLEVLEGKRVKLVALADLIDSSLPHHQDHYIVRGLSGSRVIARFAAQPRPIPQDLVFSLAVIRSRPDGRSGVVDEVQRYLIQPHPPGGDAAKGVPSADMVQTWFSLGDEFAIENCFRGFIGAGPNPLPYLSYGEWSDKRQRTTMTELEARLGAGYTIPPGF